LRKSSKYAICHIEAAFAHREVVPARWNLLNSRYFPRLNIVLHIVLSLLVWILELAIVTGVVWAIRSSLAGFLYYMEDYTTGFIKVRDLANAANAESLWILSNHTPDQLYGEYSLAIGNTKSSGFMNTLMLPGDFRSTHMYVVGASGAGKSRFFFPLIQGLAGLQIGPKRVSALRRGASSSHLLLQRDPAGRVPAAASDRRALA
jgi:hypothetical protein